MPQIIVFYIIFYLYVLWLYSKISACIECWFHIVSIKLLSMTFCCTNIYHLPIGLVLEGSLWIPSLESLMRPEILSDETWKTWWEGYGTSIYILDILVDVTIMKRIECNVFTNSDVHFSQEIIENETRGRGDSQYMFLRDGFWMLDLDSPIVFVCTFNHTT